jgi:uncharacterized membrane protein
MSHVVPLIFFEELVHLNDFLTWTRHLLALFGSLVIFTGSVVVICQFVYRLLKSRHHQVLNFDLARLGLTRSIVLGLEFIIAADVIQTTTEPDYYALGILAALAVIRSFLNYFLNKDLEQLGRQGPGESEKIS